MAVKTHVIVSAMKALGMPLFGSAPSFEILSPDVWMQDNAERACTVLDVASNTIEIYVDFKWSLNVNNLIMTVSIMFILMLVK